MSASPLSHKVVSKKEWDERRAELLKKEKQLTKERDALTAEIRDLPWVKIDKNYVFHTTAGDKTLVELFEGKTQLFVYHFMLGPCCKEACDGCSFWADHFGGFRYHLPQRDVSFKVISRASLERIQRYRDRMGWEFDWVSSADSDFNFDFGLSLGEDREYSGSSVFARNGDTVYHTYFTNGRGDEFLCPTYAILDLVPKGRDESSFSFPMDWVKLHDQY